MIAFYYGLTGFACFLYFRRELRKSVRNFVLAGVAPLVGAPGARGHLRQVVHRPVQAGELESGKAWFGLGPPVVIAIGSCSGSS